MPKLNDPKNRSVLQLTKNLVRGLAILILVILVISLFVPEIGEAGFVKQVFGSRRTSPIPPDPPGQEKPPPGQEKPPPGQSNSPPGQSNSPPGPFNSPPGQFKSPLPPYPPVGGKGAGAGPIRAVQLNYMDDNSWVNSPDASGVVSVNKAWPEDHPKYPGFPPAINYSISKLECLWRWDMSMSYGDQGRWFYSLYMTLGYSGRQRLQSFNPGCGYMNYQSTVVLPYISEEALATENLKFEIIIERDDGTDTPYAFPNYWNWVILRGEDPGN